MSFIIIDRTNQYYKGKIPLGIKQYCKGISPFTIKKELVVTDDMVKLTFKEIKDEIKCYILASDFHPSYADHIDSIEV